MKVFVKLFLDQKRFYTVCKKKKVLEAHKYFKNTKLAPKRKVKCQHSRKFQILIQKNWLRKTMLY